MKSIFILMTFLFSTATMAYTYKCEQNDVKENTKYSAIVEELKNITKEVSYGNEYDSVFKVRVTIIKTTKKDVETKSFEAIATSEDVIYNVHAVKKQGIHIGIYLDEEDEAYMTLTDKNGDKTQIGFTCR